MANVDYVVVGDVTNADVIEAVKAAADVTEVIERPRYTALHTADERAELTVAPRSWEDGTTVVEVYLGGPDEEQSALSRRVYDYLVEHTDWDVELESDNADDTIAARKMALP